MGGSTLDLGGKVPDLCIDWGIDWGTDWGIDWECLSFDLGCLCLDFKSVIWEDYGNGVLSKFKDSPVVGVDDFLDAPASSLADVQLQEDG